jgi:hypothetical protein
VGVGRLAGDGEATEAHHGRLFGAEAVLGQGDEGADERLGVASTGPLDRVHEGLEVRRKPAGVGRWRLAIVTGRGKWLGPRPDRW